MKGLSQKLKRGLLIALSIIMLVPAQSSYAATGKQKALSAYNKWLSSSKVYVMPKGASYKSLVSGTVKKYKGTAPANVKFATAYIDNDSIPELIVIDEEYHFGLFTYRGGKVVRLCYDAWWNVPVQYYKYKSIFRTTRISYLTISLNKYYCREAGQYFGKFSVYKYKKGPKHYFESFVSGNRVKLTVSRIRTRIAAYTKKASPTKITYRKNTRANRSRYLK